MRYQKEIRIVKQNMTIEPLLLCLRLDLSVAVCPGLHSFYTSFRNGWMRVSVPNLCWESVITEPAPEKCLSPQGPVPHFYKEPKKLLAFAKLFFCSVLPPVWRLHCRGTMHNLSEVIWLSATSSAMAHMYVYTPEQAAHFCSLPAAALWTRIDLRHSAKSF